MSVINYANLFNRLKVLIKYFNVLEERQVNTGATNFPLPYIKNEILSPFETQDITNEVATLEAEFDSAILSIETLKRALIGWFEDVLSGTARALGVPQATPGDVLVALTTAMKKDTQTINARELIVNANDVDADGTIKAHTGNTGSGRLSYTFTIALGASEIANVEVLGCECISSTTPKQEVFQLLGEQKNNRESHLGQGSGTGPTLTALGESISNGDFEDWTGSDADNWTATVGTWGTQIVKETTSVYEGTNSVKTVYAQGNWKITHAMPITLQPSTVYVIALWVKKDTGATGTLRFGISNGNAVDAFVSGCVKTVSIADITTAYTLQWLAFKTPTAVSSTWKLGISVASPAVADIYLDLAQFGAMTNFNSMHFAVCSGAVGFGIDDKFGFGSENVGFKVEESASGVIQKFIGRMFSTQLPSATGGAETIADPA